MASDQPYSNMKARTICLIIGLVFSILGFLMVLVAYMCTFIPGLVIPLPTSRIVALIALLATSIFVSFAGTVLTIAGANTKKPLARLSMFFSFNGFIAGAAFLFVTLLIHTILPIDALDRWIGCSLLLM